MKSAKHRTALRFAELRCHGIKQCKLLFRVVIQRKIMKRTAIHYHAWFVAPVNFIAATMTAPGGRFSPRFARSARGDYATSSFAASILSTAIGSYPARVSKPDISRRSDSEASTMITLFMFFVDWVKHMFCNCFIR